MGSPITSEDFNIQNFSGDVCESIKKLLEVNNKLKTWFAWAFDANGNATPAFTSTFAAVLMPTGGIIFMPVFLVPQGWLLCNGAEVSRTTYAALFARIGTGFGAPSDSSKFKLPNLQDKYLTGSGASAVGASVGSNSVTLTIEQVPEHKHRVPALTISGGSEQVPAPWGSIAVGTNGKIVDDSANNFDRHYPYSEPLGSGQSHENRPSSLVGLWLIKT